MQLAIFNPSILDPTLFQACVAELYRLLVNGRVGKIEKAWFLIVTSLIDYAASLLLDLEQLQLVIDLQGLHFHGDSH